VARVFERMADAGAAIQRSHALQWEVAPPEGAEGDVVVDVAAPSGDEQGGVPEPPVDVSGRVPWALRDGAGSNGSDGETEDVSLESASLGPSGTARLHDDDLAGSRFSGPVADPRIHH
jgi:hypothetical protein